jgi:hypothetical protein
LFEPADEPVVEGVVDDVLHRRLVLLVRLDHLGPVAAAEDVILPLVAFVEGAGVAAVQVPHPVGQVRQRGFDEEVVVIPHQAAHVRAPAVAPFDPAQDVEEHDPVAIVHDDRSVVVAADPDVVEGTRFEVTKRPSHRSKVTPREPLSPRRDGFASRPARSCHVPGTRLGRTRRGPHERVSRGRPGLRS